MSKSMKNTYDAIALFSGGLDSILAVKVLEEQGIKVKCLHFVTPFFGKPERLSHWRKAYNLDISSVDIGQEFVQILQQRPEHGFGKLLNPCVDCKILLMRAAQQQLEKYGASFVISGEVLGQRPMSQRRDTLNVIRKESGIQEKLLRPLSARLLQPSAAELSGLVDREKLHAISGRGRKKQMELAAHFGITDIPTPAGGCMLAEQENASRYWMVLTRLPQPTPQDFTLAHTGRQYWDQGGKGRHWLAIGRNAASNAALQELTQPTDYVFRLRDFAGPLAVGRPLRNAIIDTQGISHCQQKSSDNWEASVVLEAAAFVASYAPKAVQAAQQNQDGRVAVMVRRGKQGQPEEVLFVQPQRQPPLCWQEPLWEDAKRAKKEEFLAQQGQLDK